MDPLAVRTEARKGFPASLGRRVTWLVVLLAAPFLLLWNLGDQSLWQDEAQTALVSKTILTYGVPLGHDGLNSFSQNEGREVDRDLLYKWHPWLPFYLLAASFRLLGVSTASARLPFALLGLASLLLVYRLGEALFPGRRLGTVAVVLLLATVPFLIMARQCRYYSPAIFFSLLCLDGYVRGRYRWVLGLGSVCLFFSHSLYFAAVWFAVLAHAASFQRQRLKELILIALVSAGLPLAWLAYTLDMAYYDTNLSVIVRARFLRYLAAYLRQIGRYLFHPLWLLLPLLGLAARRVTKRPLLPTDRTWLSGLVLLLFFLLGNLVLVATFGVAIFFRYLGPMIPGLCLLLALLLSSLTAIHRFALPLALVLYVATSNLPSFVYEITHELVDPTKAVARYLNQHGKDTDLVVVSYGDMPLKLYTKMKVLGGLTGESLLPATHADWIWLRKHVNTPTDAATKTFLLEHVDFSKYRSITLAAPDTLFDNREEPALHRFRTESGEEPVVIFQRVAR